MKTKLLIISLLLGSSFVFSQEQQAPKENEFSLTFQLRPRAEYRMAYYFPEMKMIRQLHLSITEPVYRWIMPAKG